tara:strand:+ start:413 stop:814 length:402 start_codon:yes stop_codon:yes gene_type:complete
MKKNDEKIQIYTTALMLQIASADGQIDAAEINIIKDILIDYFKIDKKRINQLVEESEIIREEMIDIYELASFVNNHLNLQDKIDLICCYFEVAYADGNLHFLERHTIKQIANVLNINKEQLRNAEKEIKKYLL